MSDFHEMATNLKLKKTNDVRIADLAHMVDYGGRRLGIERRIFDYSHYLPGRRVGNDRRVMPERRAESRLEA